MSTWYRQFRTMDVKIAPKIKQRIFAVMSSVTNENTEVYKGIN
jgi:hypothetical protein